MPQYRIFAARSGAGPLSCTLTSSLVGTHVPRTYCGLCVHSAGQPNPALRLRLPVPVRARRPH
eukprot:15462268-Alexandrium_andersonii.AAC.1